MSWRDKREAGSLSGIRFIAAARRLVGRRCIWLILYFPVDVQAAVFAESAEQSIM